MKQTLLAICGKPGLYRLVARGNGNLIVESIDEQKRRITAGSRDRVTSLRDVSMYTMDDDKPLMEVFESIKEKYNGQRVDIQTSKADKAQLFAFLDEVLPDNDADRIYPGDVKKLIQWYNILVQAGYTDFLEAEEQEEASAEAAPAE